MAAVAIAAWIPEEYSGSVITRIMSTSAVEALARRENMGSSTRSVPRSSAVTSELVAKSATYSEDNSTNDDVTLTAYKFGLMVRVAEEDQDDSIANVIQTKRNDWATAYARHLDHACLAVSAVANGTTVAFNSLYYELVNTTRPDYVAGDNVTTIGTGVDPDYDDLSAVLGLVETGDYFDPGAMVWIMDPSFREILRGIKDTQDRPIFIEGNQGTPDTLFGFPIRWTFAMKLSATSAVPATGDALAFIGNRNYMILGVRSGPESMMAGGDAAFDTDEILLKMRSRRGFAVGEPGAFACLRNTP